MTFTGHIFNKPLLKCFLWVMCLGVISCVPLLEHKTIDIDYLKPSAAVLQEIKSIKKIRLVSVESVEPDTPKAKFNLEHNLQEIFKAFPELEMVPSDAAHYDATLTITINGHLHGEEFIHASRSPTGYLSYYGKPFIKYIFSTIDGAVTLDLNRSPVYKWGFDYESDYYGIAPANGIKPSRFRWNMELRPLYSRICAMLADICGVNVLMTALKNKDNDWRVSVESFRYLTDGEAALKHLISMSEDLPLSSKLRSDAIEVIGKIGDIRVVETLIGFLKQCGPNDSYAANIIADALQMITGYPPEKRRFFPVTNLHVTDADSWEKWWKKNKSQYIQK